MSSHVARSFVRCFAALHAVAGCAVFLFSVYIAFARPEPAIWLVISLLVPAAAYFAWVGRRGWRQPTPRVVRMLCGSIALVLGLPYVIAVEWAGVSRESPAVVTLSVLLVTFLLWTGTFGGGVFSRSLFPDEKRAGPQKA
jgi:hypothetical protein